MMERVLSPIARFGSAVLLVLLAVALVGCEVIGDVFGPDQSNDASLSSLTVDTGTLTPGFSPDITQYSIEVDPSVRFVTVRAEPADQKAAIDLGTGSTFLSSDPTLIEVRVRAEDGGKRSYFIQAFRGLTPRDPTLENISVWNGGFETGKGSVDSQYVPDNWTKGGTWGGGWEWTSAVVTGKRAAWSSFKRGGPENGFSQELSARAQSGTYFLTVWAGGDSDAGLTSRIILGYASSPGSYTELGHDEVSASNAGWKRQVLKVVVPSSSPAIGKPLWIRLTGTSTATGSGGDSNHWDDVNLHYCRAIDRPIDNDPALGLLDLGVTTSDATGNYLPLSVSPAFDPAVTDYTVESPPEFLAYLRLMAFPANWTSRVSGVTYRRLQNGTNTFELSVTSEAGSVRTYVFHAPMTTVRLRVLDLSNNHAFYTNFSSSYPGIDFQVEDLPSAGALATRLLADQAQGSLPEVFGHPFGHRAEAVLEAAKDLTTLMGASWLTRFDAPAVSVGTWNGVVKAVPTCRVLTGVAFTNNRLATPPTSYAEAKSLAENLGNRGIMAYVTGGSDRWMLQSPYFSTILGRLIGPSFVSGIYDGSRQFTDPDFVDVLRVYRQTVTDKVMDPASLTLKYHDALAVFRNGNAAFLVNGSWTPDAFVTGHGNGVEIPVAEQAYYSVHELPPFAGNEPFPHMTAGVWGSGYAVNGNIPAGSAQERAAQAFLSWVYGASTGQAVLERGNTIPSWTSVLDLGKVEPIVLKTKAFLDGVGDNMCPILDASFGEPLVTVINDSLYNLAAGTLTEAEAAAAMQASWTAMPK